MAFLGNNIAAAAAFNRFGLGARPDDVIPAFPANWLLDQLIGQDPYSGAGLPTTQTALALFQTFRVNLDNVPVRTSISQQIWANYRADAADFLNNALTTRTPFRERMVWFWSNHFAQMVNSNVMAGLGGAFVREAIRPHVNGTFKDMLLAVMQHPAMLYNLNNQMSAGPQSPLALKCSVTGCGHFGINENLGRECLELHTVGVNAGYTQADVDAMAMLLTGWSVNTAQAPLGFFFNANLHQPGAQTLMGQTFAGTLSGAIQALTFLGTHPATYTHLATKLATHFIADVPAASDIASIAQALARSGGSLMAACSALISLPSAWTVGAKLRGPQDYVVAVLRAMGATGPGGGGSVTDPVDAVAALGAPVWQPPFPNGYSDLAVDWASPAGVMLRADWVNALANASPGADAATIAASSLGPLLRSTTAAAMTATASPHDRLVVLFASPEFQRR